MSLPKPSARRRLQRSLRLHEDTKRPTFDAEGAFYRVHRQGDGEERAPKPQPVRGSDVLTERDGEVVKVPWDTVTKAKELGYSQTFYVQRAASSAHSWRGPKNDSIEMLIVVLTLLPTLLPTLSVHIVACDHHGSTENYSKVFTSSGFLLLLCVDVVLRVCIMGSTRELRPKSSRFNIVSYPKGARHH
ncbi:hypothetical protein ERJ75_000508600 [Trypanosoma vivax]|nr:hypothetical protein ERJ75_000508600 [Trypanosoma vivax]